MSKFWADKLAREAAARPVPAAPSPAPYRDTWWGSEVYTRPHGQNPPQTPAPAPQAAPSRARHQAASGSCPACFGENYFRPSPNNAQTCFDCGYPVQHSTSGMTAPNNAQETTRPALGQSRGQGYRPDIIVGRI